MVFECAHQPGGTHIIEDQVIEEVLDPITLEPVGFGERGERVVTSFGRGTIPLLRYRTGDLVCRIPANRCSCGRGFDIYEGGILGRVDDMKVIRGTNVYPRAIEAIVREFPEVDEFQTVITHEGIRDEITLRVEMKPDWPAESWEQLSDSLRRRLGHAHEGLNFRIDRAGAGELPRFELKAKRMIDRREASMAPIATAPTPAGSAQ
jgi:phenylacetate-CoA ligase